MFKWATGLGDSYDVHNNDSFADAFRNADKVNQAREYWYKKVNSGEKTITDSLTNFLGKKDPIRGNFGLTGVWKAGLDPAEQFVGSFRTEIYSDGKVLTYQLTNTTSLNSGAYGAAPDYDRHNWWITPGGNITQKITFTENINFGKIITP